MYIKKLKIGNLELENNLILAPMAGITDLPFQIVCKKYGNPGLICNEMVSSKAIVYNDSKTFSMIESSEMVRPISMQIFGSSPETMGQAAKFISNIADIVDINMGCPAPKVVKNGDGSKLLLDLDLAKEIIQSVVNNSSKPVTLKMRKGWDNDNIAAVELAKIAQECGVSAIIVHGRTRSQFYSGNADWDIIKKVKDNVKIPVIGNGDVVDGETAKLMFEKTGCDGIMVGRGTLGNPWIFKEIAEFLKNGNNYNVSNDLKLMVIKEHYNLLLKQKGEYTASREIRKHISWYVKGLQNASIFRDKINHVEDEKTFFDLIDEYFSSL